MPHAGGQYVYLREAFGPLAGFLFRWTCRGDPDRHLAAVAVAFAKYTGIFFPYISDQNYLVGSGGIVSPRSNSGHRRHRLPHLEATQGIRTGATVQNVFTFARSARSWRGGRGILVAATRRGGQQLHRFLAPRRMEFRFGADWWASPWWGLVQLRLLEQCHLHGGRGAQSQAQTCPCRSPSASPLSAPCISPAT